MAGLPAPQLGRLDHPDASLTIFVLCFYIVSYLVMDPPDHQVALHRAVLHALTRSLNGSPGAPTFDIQRLLNSSEYQMDAENVMSALADTDWRDVKASRDKQPFPVDGFMRLYDEQSRTIYHVDTNRFEPPHLMAKPFDHVDRNELYSSDLSSAAGHQNVLERPDVREVLSRLTLENGHFAPRNYREWMSKKLQSRLPVRDDTPGCATLCKHCHTVLTQSLGLYSLVVRQCFEDEEHDAEKTDIWPLLEVFDHHETMDALRASAKANCHMCSLIIGPGIIEERHDTCSEAYSPSSFLGVDYFTSSCRISMMHSNDRPIVPVWLGFKSQLRDIPSTLKHLNTRAPEVMQLARTWLDRCVQEHNELCSPTSTYLPSRLVRITAGQEHGSLRSASLALREELPADTPYLTLSHCWGGLEVVSLKGNILSNFRTDIPLSCLSKTFRDALVVTTWLGYQYIWIDSLCIIQDSPSDWDREARSMGSIYRNSTCTIAATGAKNGNVGLFFDRFPLTYTRCPLYKLHNEQASALNDCKWPKPLSSRAWAVQERYLSPRILSFGLDTISWSCRRTAATEGPQAHDIYMKHHAFPKLLEPHTDATTLDFAWFKIVKKYSRCKLTLWKDKWPAFQGLASEVAKAQGWKIVHGLREHLLVIDLIWHSIQPELGTIEFDEPSWSWLNVKGGVLTDISRYAPFSLDAKVRLHGPSDPLVPGQVARDTSDHTVWIDAHIAKFRTYPREQNVMAVECAVAVTNPVYKSDRTDRVVYGCWFPDTDEIDEGDLWAIPLVNQRSSVVGGSVIDQKGLTIAAVEGRPGYWRRVGMFSCQEFFKTETELLHYPWSHERSTIYLV